MPVKWYYRSQKASQLVTRHGSWPPLQTCQQCPVLLETGAKPLAGPRGHQDLRAGPLASPSSTWMAGGFSSSPVTEPQGQPSGLGDRVPDCRSQIQGGPRTWTKEPSQLCIEAVPCRGQEAEDVWSRACTWAAGASPEPLGSLVLSALSIFLCSREHTNCCHFRVSAC